MSLRKRLASEDGLGVVVAIAVMGITIMISGVAVQKAVSTLDRSNRAENVKSALQAADAGLDAAVYQLNRLDLGNAMEIDPQKPDKLNGQSCVTNAGSGTFAGKDPDSSSTDSQGRRWCPAVSEDLGDGRRYSYRVSQVLRLNLNGCGSGGVVGLHREIIAVGTKDGQSRRVRARMIAAVSLLSRAAVQSASDTAPLIMSGSAKVVGDVHANHDIIGTSLLTSIAGNAVPGPGNPPHTVSGVAVTGSRLPACQRLVLPNVAQADVATNNDNGLWDADCMGSAICTGSIAWDPGTRTLTLSGNRRLKLTGSNYSFCRLRLEGSSALQVPQAVPVARIFLDDPANCGGVAGAGQLTVDGTARFVNCHGPSEPQTLQVYAVGSATAMTTQTLAGGANLVGSALGSACGSPIAQTHTPMILYAPRSAVVMGGFTGISGQVAGNTVYMTGSASVATLASLANLSALGGKPILPLYQPTDYVECTAVGFQDLPANEPAQKC